MSESIEFSEFFRLLNSTKEGGEEKIIKLEEKMIEFKSADDTTSFLEELGKNFIYIGLTELFKYAETKDLKFISNIEKEKWEELAEKNKFQLPQFLANAMINHAKENKLSKKLAAKWNNKQREVNKHIRPMAQYITEGIIDFLE